MRRKLEDKNIRKSPRGSSLL